MPTDTPACLPPADAADGSEHYLVKQRSGDTRHTRMTWRGKFWSCREGFGAPAALAAEGWRYHSPIPSPDALAALVHAAREMRNRTTGVEYASVRDVWHHLDAALADPAIAGVK